MAGSITEVKRMVDPKAFLKIRPRVAKRDWEIIGFTSSTLILRVEDQNFELSRSTGEVKSSFSLSGKSKKSR